MGKGASGTSFPATEPRIITGDLHRVSFARANDDVFRSRETPVYAYILYIHACSARNEPTRDRHWCGGKWRYGGVGGNNKGVVRTRPQWRLGSGNNIM